MQPELIGHGAQAKVFKYEDENGKPYVVKERIPKKYRHPKLDEQINSSRVKSQSKILKKVLKIGIKVPQLLNVQPKENKIIMEFIDGIKLKNYINDNAEDEEKIKSALIQLSSIVKNLHDNNIIHGDLTTSNMILREDTIYLLDFGLGQLTATIEDKAVDLYLFEKAFVATHPKLQQSFQIFLEEYGEKAVLAKLQKVRQRGRKKVAFG